MCPLRILERELFILSFGHLTKNKQVPARIKLNEISFPVEADVQCNFLNEIAAQPDDFIF